METKGLEELKPDPRNPRIMGQHDATALRNSMFKFGDLGCVVFNVRTQQMVGGHQRRNMFEHLPGDRRIVVEHRYQTPDEVGTVALGYIFIGNRQFAYREVDWDENTQHAANIAANRISGDFDQALLAELTYELSIQENGPELLALTGMTEEEWNKLLTSVGVGPEGEPHGNLADDFIVPPFSILDTRQGYWQERKDNWLSLGLKSEVGRDDDLLYGTAQGRTDVVSQKIMQAGGGTSVFDPVLCEIMYRWFNIANGSVLDPFAGGSVRGVVAARLGYDYTGIELSERQVIANREQATELCPVPPTWINGDSNIELEKLTDQYDMVFSCPPYADLEVYSDNPADISNMPYTEFLSIYRSIIAKAVQHLRNDRFAAFVVGEVRQKTGQYYNLVGDTIQAFKDAGMSYYNELILVNNIGSLPLRTAKTFNAGRKVGKCHQNVLVFYKGDPKVIKGNYGELDFSTQIEETSGEKDLQ